MATKKKTAEAAEDKAKQDIDTFITTPKFVTTVDGEQVPLARMVWGREIKLLGVIQSVLDFVADDISNFGEEGFGVPHLISKVMEQAPEKVSEFMLIILPDRDEAWIEENLELAEIIGVIVPLLRSRIDLIGAKLGTFVETAVAQKAALQDNSNGSTNAP